MATNKKPLTEEDILALTFVKMRDPNMTLDDLYKRIDKIHPSLTKKMVYHSIVPVLLILTAIYVLIFQKQHEGLQRASHIVYLISSAWIVRICNKFEKGLLLPIIFLIIIWYIATTSELDLQKVWSMIEDAVL